MKKLISWYGFKTNLTWILCLVLFSNLLLAGCGEGAKTGSKEGMETAQTETSLSGSETVSADADQTAIGNSESFSTSDNAGKLSYTGNPATKQMQELNSVLSLNMPDDKYRTCYEVFVYSYCDSDGDGIGDLQGLISKLDVINDGDPATDTDLGFNEIWLMPICPSPTYHKYDVTDYMAIDPQYGTMDDFDQLVEECHRRGINLILDTVINHTSSEHPWFKEAAAYIKGLGQDEEPDSTVCPYVNYYRFTKEPQAGYEKLPGSSWYYEARFWSGMPDLDLQNGAVREEIEEMTKFWIDHGADGFRMDAVTSYETDHHDENIEILRWFHDMAITYDPDTYIVGECWTGIDTYSRYYRSGVDSFFDFAFAGSEGVIAKTVLESRKASDFVNALVMEEELMAANNAAFVNAPFYTNHDMARSAGYYAKESEARVKLSGAMNLFMTGNAFVYYGEELGMKGSGKDENKRLPYGWTSDKEAPGMTTGPKDSDYSADPYAFGFYEEQIQDPASVLNFYKEAVRIRNAYPVIARGKTLPVEALCTDALCTFIRSTTFESLEEIDLKTEDAQETSPASGKAAYEPVVVLINTGADAVDADLTLLPRRDVTLSAVLLTGEEEVTRNGDLLTLPGRSADVLTFNP